jgi:SAM-dependent methyltransferase
VSPCASRSGSRRGSASSIMRRMFYGEDVAHTHDTGHSRFAEGAGTWLAGELSPPGLVVELGCGSGVTCAALTDAGWDVLGIDGSAPMLEIARRRAPRARIEIGSAYEPVLPECVAVTAIGEVLNYIEDPDAPAPDLAVTFARVRNALLPGGLFVFDVAAPGRVPGGGPSRRHYSGDDWAILVETCERPDPPTLTRQMTTFRQIADGTYRRGYETHYQRLYRPPAVTAMLRSAGFRVRVRRGYHGARFAPGHSVFVARRPLRG